MFITLEGPDGSGKTSHMQPLAEWLEGEGYRVHTAREPGGTLISEQIRNIIHDLKNTEMHPHTETLLYQAARAQIVEQVLRPKLAEGWIVLCDRYADSTLAYQGYGHQQNLDEVRALVRLCHRRPGPGPDSPAGCGCGNRLEARPAERAAANGTAWMPTSSSSTGGCGQATWSWRSRSPAAGWWWMRASRGRRFRKPLRKAILKQIKKT